MILYQELRRIHSRMKSSYLEWVLSPYGAAALSFLIFLFAWVLPPSMYSAGLDEYDYMYLDLLGFAFFFICVVSFVVGVRVGERGSRFCACAPLPGRVNPVLFVLAPLILTISFELLAVIIVYNQYPGVLTAIFSGAGNAVKGELIEIMLPPGVSAAAPVVLVVMFWAYNAYLGLADPRQKKIVGWVLALYVTITFVISLVQLGRNQMMMMLVGLAVIKSAHAVRQGRSEASFGGLVVKVVVGLILLFLVTAMLRQTSTSEMLGAFYGYTISGYNRMVAILHQHVIYLDAGNGDHLLNGILQNRTINMLVPFQDMYDLPKTLDVWIGDFSAVAEAGLMPQYNFASCFGFMFIDVGWLTPGPVFLCGVFSGYIWRMFKRGKTIGVVVYPTVLFAVLMWFGVNLLVHMNTIIALLSSAALALYETFFARVVITVSRRA